LLLTARKLEEKKRLLKNLKQRQKYLTIFLERRKIGRKPSPVGIVLSILIGVIALRDFCSKGRISFIVKARAPPIRYTSTAGLSNLAPPGYLHIDKNADGIKVRHC